MEYEALKYIGAALATIGMVGGALAVGQIFSAFLTGIARNPGAESKMFKNALIGAGMAEALGLFAFVLGFLILSAGN